MNDILAKVSKEIGLKEPMSINDLADAYLSIRQQVQMLRADADAQWREARADGYAAGVKAAKEDMVEIHTLRGMTVGQLTSLIGVDE